MIETLLVSLICGLFIYEVVILRMLMKRQINHTLKTLVEDWNPEAKSVNVLPVPKQSLAFQESIKQIKD
jgi:hypothetical protein